MQQRIRPCVRRRLGQFHRVSGAVASPRRRSPADGRAAFGRRRGDDPDMLLIGQGGGFPRGPHRDDGVRPILQMKIQQPVQFLVIDGKSSFMGVTNATADPLNISGFILVASFPQQKIIDAVLAPISAYHKPD